MIELPVGRNTTVLQVLRVVMALLSPFMLWAICVLLSADMRPPREVILATIALPILIVGFILMLVWSNRAARPMPPPVDDGWPKSPPR